MKNLLLVVLLVFGTSHAAEKTRLLFFSKSSGFEHTVIQWNDGLPSHADKVIAGLAEQNNWEVEYSKDGSKFSADYLAQFDGLIFYTSGDLTKAGRDKHPPIPGQGMTALLDYIRKGGGFIGLHCASDTFRTPTKDKYVDAEKCSDFICMLGGEFISHGKQQNGTNKVINPNFPGYENAGVSFTLHEEWYALKNLAKDMHALTVLQTEGMDGMDYKRPPYPTSWARMEGKGRVYYNAMGHREDIWTHALFKEMLTGAVKWTTGQAEVAIPANLEKVAPGAGTNIIVDR